MLQHQPHRMALAAVVIAVVLAGCGHDRGPFLVPPAPPAPPDPGPALLTLADVQALRSAPHGLKQATAEVAAELLESTPGYVAPHTLGPCGGDIGQSPQDRARVVFDSTSPDGTIVVNFIYGLTAEQAEQVIAQFRADMHPGCPAVPGQTSTGPVWREFRGEVPLASLGDNGVAAGYQTSYDPRSAVMMTALVRSGGNLSAVVILARTRISQAFLTDLAIVSAKKLAKLK